MKENRLAILFIAMTMGLLLAIQAVPDYTAPEEETDSISSVFDEEEYWKGVSDDIYNRAHIYASDAYDKVYGWDSIIKNAVEREGDQHFVKGTVYNPVPEQTDGDPTTTADGSKINMEDLAAGKLNWIAISQDLLDFYSYGEEVLVYLGENHPMNGRYIIHDCMNVSKKKQIDFLKPIGEDKGKWDCILLQKTIDIDGNYREWGI